MEFADNELCEIRGPFKPIADLLKYLNTDLDLVSAMDLQEFAASLEARGLFALHVTQVPDGTWLARFETEHQHVEPEANILAVLRIVESLSANERAIWDGCSMREFNVGYEHAGDDGSGFGFSVSLLARAAALKASLRVTLYGSSDEG